MLKIALVGYGYWGQVLLTKFQELNPRLVKKVVDIRSKRLDIVRKQYSHIAVATTIEPLLNDKEIDAVVIATPAHSHFKLAKKALLAGKHVLVEKPMTTSVREAEELIRLSKKRSRVLMVDHTVLYTKAVQKLKKLINNNVLGNIKYFDATRINLGLFQSDINVLWDLAAHDLAVLQHLIDERPYSVQAIGISHDKKGIENIGYLSLRYKSGMIAHFNCSWISPVKIRLTLIGGDKKMIVFNDIEPTEKIKIYNKGYHISSDSTDKQMLVNYRIGDVLIPKLEINDAVIDMIKDFINAIKNKRKPVSNSQLSLSIVKILDFAQRSIAKRGKEIAIP